MSKQMLTIIADEDVIDELASSDNSCFWLTNAVDISDEEFNKYTDTNDKFWAKVTDEMHDEVIRAYKEWKEEIEMNRENTERLMAYERKEAMENAKKDTANNPINSYMHGFADGYSKGFIDATELLMRNEGHCSACSIEKGSPTCDKCKYKEEASNE